MKYSLEFKLECIEKFKNGEKISPPDGFTGQIESFMHNVRDWNNAYKSNGIRALSKNGQTILTLEEKLVLVRSVIVGGSVNKISAAAGIGHGNLSNWVKLYKQYGEEGLKCCDRGRKKEFTMTKTKKSKISPTVKEELKLLRERNKYLEAEVEYLKKLNALELQKVIKQAKAKK